MILGNVQSQGNKFLEMSMTRGTKIFSCPLLWVPYRQPTNLQAGFVLKSTLFGQSTLLQISDEAGRRA